MAPRNQVFLAIAVLLSCFIQTSLSAPVNATKNDILHLPPMPTLHWATANETLLQRSADSNTDCASVDDPRFDDLAGTDAKKRATDISISSAPPISKRQEGVQYFWLCSTGDHPDYGRGLPNSNRITYPQEAVLDAAITGEVYRLRNNRVNNYPHRFMNRERLPGLIRECGESRNLWEFPILPNGNLYNGGSPQLDRVIWDTCSQRVCGVITHRGKANNHFQDCQEEATL